ncbi:branched-chain amino acid ABC transporter substrate-binding protein [Undibacterium sp.]|uniref:branched-chain amino acid ABC transporter substrate-binding protein n=1 Tax=Undibacterium sp. TaxID=1914977 RepID=UPI0025DC3A44|nr:branched-chain amino acid ABC transporter substrate-binding protein [Undibacterium sp.]
MKLIGPKLAAVSLMLLVSACSRQVEVKIGILGPMTGDLAANGLSLAQGAQIAVDELNGNKFLIDGKTAHFSLVLEDDKAKPEEASAAAKRLVDAGVAAVYGPANSNLALLTAPVFAKAGIPQMSSATNPKYTRMGLASAFRITADDVEQGATLGRISLDKLHAKKIFLLDDGSTFGSGLMAEVNTMLKAKKAVFSQESILPASVNYLELAKKINDSLADVVVYGGNEQAGLAILKALRGAGSSARFVTGDTLCDAEVIKKAEGNANTAYFCTIAGVSPSWLAAGAAFVEKYKAKHGDVGTRAPLAYDAVHIFAQAMQKASSSVPAVFLPEMKKSALDGKIQGSVEFDAKGDLKDATVVIFEAVNGKLVEQSNKF